MEFFLNNIWYVLLLGAFSYIVWEILMHRRAFSNLHLPPGPRSLPFIGYLPFLGRESHKTLSQLAKKYGSIFGLNIGMQYFIVLDNFQGMKELSTKDEFLDRPPEYFQMSKSYPNLVEISAPVWEDVRRFHISTFQKLGMGRKMTEQYVLSEIKELIESMAKKTEERSVNLSELLGPTFDNIILTLLYGKKFDPSHSYTQQLPATNYALSMKYRFQEDSVYFPLLYKLLYLIKPEFKTYDAQIEAMTKIVSNEIAEHQANLNVDDPKDYIDYFLLKMQNTESGDLHGGFNENSLVGNVIMLLGAGSVTTSLTLTWLLMALALHRDIQERCYQEIMEALGPEQDPEIDDQIRLPYTCATIAESQRFNPISFVNLIRQCNTSGAKLGGFDVPKGTMIIQNLWSVNFNKELWQEPEQFNPERFLIKSDGQLQLKIPEYMTPFSCGKRMCPGSKVASQSLFLFTVCFIQHFRFLPPEDGVSMEHFLMFNVVPTKPFVRFERRS